MCSGDAASLSSLLGGLPAAKRGGFLVLLCLGGMQLTAALCPPLPTGSERAPLCREQDVKLWKCPS